VQERPHDLAWLYETYSAELKASGRRFEFVFALEPWNLGRTDVLEPLRAAGEPIQIIRVGQSASESVLLGAAAAASSYPVVVTLPAYPRVEPGALEELVGVVEDGAEMATAVRSSGRASVLNRVQRWAFHAILGRTAGGRFRDVASGVTAMWRWVLGDLPLYGDLFRFLPVLAAQEGFTVVEHEVAQHPGDRRARVYGPGIYLRRILDLIGVAFLVRFTQKPLRFFGLVGSLLAIPGSVIMLIIFVQRIGGRELAERPLLLLGTLLFVIGTQAISLGLIGEMIVHLSAGGRPRYRVREMPAPGDAKEE
jgi:hypothetical protein